MPGQIAEAFVRIRPDFSQFQKDLTAGLTGALSGSTAALTAATGSAAKATAVLSAEQVALTKTTLGLQSAETILSSRYAQTLPILGALTAEQAALDVARKKSIGTTLGLASSSGKLDAALLGLRSAVGSSAVIGLGAGALAAIALGKAFRASIQATAAFEEQLNVLKATAGATDEELTRVSAAALRLGADVKLPAVSAADAAEAMNALVRAGLSVNEAIDGAEGVLQLATAAQISNAEAADLAANALNAFGLAGRDATRVADVLANAANAAQGSISDFGAALAQSAAVARQAGISLEDTTAVLTLLAQNGLRGSDAGTSLRTALLRLVAPTGQAAELIRALGLNIRDTQGNVRPEVFAQFGEATAALGPEIRDAAAALIFGQDAIRAVAIAAREGEQGLEVMRFKLDQQGTAAEVAAARNEGLAGSLRALQSTAESAGISFGSTLSPALQGTAGFFTDLIRVVDLTGEAIVKLGEKSDEVFGDRGFLRRVGSGFKEALTLTGPEILLGFLDEVGVTGAKAEERVKKLNEELLLLQKARVSAAEGGDLGLARSFTPQIKELREEIAKLGAEAPSIVPLTETERDLAKLESALRSLGEAREAALGRGDTDAAADLDKLIISTAQSAASLSKKIAAGIEDGAKTGLSGLKKSLEVALQVFETDPTGPIAEKSLRSIRNLIERIRAEGGNLSGAAGKEIGKRLMDAMGTSITAEEASVIASARQALRNAIRAADEQVRAAVTSARDNLQSLGNDLSSQIEQIIDVGPIGRKIQELNDELDALQERTSRRQLRFDVSQAEIDLREAKEAIAQVGKLTPAQKAAQAEFLAPFQQKVDDAKAKVKEFTLEGAIKQQEDLKQAAIDTANEGIDKIIDAFEDGRITADQFNKRLSNLIDGPLNILKSKFGKNLGIEFTDQFFENVRNLRDQVRELVGFLNVKPDTGVVDVGEAAAQGQQGVTAARVSLNEAIRKATENTSENSDDMVTLLEDILDALGGKGGTRKTSAPTGGGGKKK